MALNIATDTAFLLASKSSDRNTITLNQSMERLTSGLRINSASDDAAGVAVATRINSDVQGMRMAIRNATDGQSMINTAEGAMVEITNILQRMRELAIQAANGTNSPTDRDMIQLEIDQLTMEVDRIAQSTQWAGQSIFNGARGANELATSHTEAYTTNFQIGSTPNDADNIEINFRAITALALGIEGEGIKPTITASSVATTATSATIGSDNTTVSDTSADEINLTVSASVTKPLLDGFEALIGSNQNEASIDFDSYEEGAEYSVEINGQKFSITASTSDGYSNDIDGLAGKMIATINAATHDVTGYPLGLTATVNGSSNSKVDLGQLVDASVINNFQVGTHTVDDTALGAVTMTTSNTIKYDEDDGATFTNFSIIYFKSVWRRYHCSTDGC